MSYLVNYIIQDFPAQLHTEAGWKSVLSFSSFNNLTFNSFYVNFAAVHPKGASHHIQV